MLIIGAKLTAVKIEVPSYKIRCSKQQQQQLFHICLSINLDLGQARMKKIVKIHLYSLYFAW